MKGEKQREGSESREQREGAAEINSSHFRKKWIICRIQGFIFFGCSVRSCHFSKALCAHPYLLLNKCAGLQKVVAL